MPSNKLLKEKKHLEITSHYIAEKKKKITWQNAQMQGMSAHLTAYTKW